jgi:hypothetical protein
MTILKQSASLVLIGLNQPRRKFKPLDLSIYRLHRDTKPVKRAAAKLAKRATAKLAKRATA